MPEKRKITKKVISSKSVKKVEEKVEEEVKTETLKPPQKRGCSFCHGKKNPTFTDMVTLKRFISDREKIISRTRTGNCSKHQRQVTREIKYARHLSLLPFTPKV